MPDGDPRARVVWFRHQRPPTHHQLNPHLNPRTAVARWRRTHRTKYGLAAVQLSNAAAVALGPAGTDMFVRVAPLLEAPVTPTALEPRNLVLFEKRINVAVPIPLELGLVAPRELLHDTCAFGKVVLN